MTTPVSKPVARQQQHRTWYGTLGNACDVLVAVNDVPVAARTTIVMSSGARLIVRPDGSWVYRACAGRGPSLDAFSYALQTPAGRSEGMATVDLADLGTRSVPRVSDRRDGWLNSNSGDGRSAAEPLQLSYEMLTGTTLNLQLRESDSTEHSDRAVVLLETDAALNASVDADGIINIIPQPGFQGTACLHVLAESANGRSEWLEICIAVNPPLRMLTTP